MTTQTLISLPVISIYEQKIVGIITNIYFHRKRVAALKVVDENTYDEYIIFYKDIHAVGQLAVIINNMSKLHLKASVESRLESYSTPLGHMAFSLDGEIFGTCTYCELDSNLKVVTCHVGEYNLDKSVIHFCKNCIVISKNFNVKQYAQQYTFNVPKQADLKVTIQQSDTKSISSLIGKTTTKDIMTQNGEVLVKSGTRINASMVAKLSTLGKIKELFANAK